jgi:uncharacterized membrane protein
MWIALLLGVISGSRNLVALAFVLFARHTWWWIPAALGSAYELIGDKMPKTPPRTLPILVVARAFGGALTAFLWPIGISSWTAAAFGAIGAVIGTYGFFYIRKMLTEPGRLPDLPVAIGEDIVTIGLAYYATHPVHV